MINQFEAHLNSLTREEWRQFFVTSVEMAKSFRLFLDYSVTKHPERYEAKFRNQAMKTLQWLYTAHSFFVVMEREFLEEDAKDKRRSNGNRRNSKHSKK